MSDAPSHPSAERPRGIQRFFPPLLLVLAGVAAYHNSFYGAFVFDDVPAIRDNPTIRTLWPLTTPLSPPANTGVGGRPLANLSFALNHALGGGDVRGYHAGNLLLHLGSALLLFGFLRRTWRGASPWAASSIALLWCVHPLTSAAVSYLSQRTELLAGLLYLLTLYAFARGADANRSGWLAVSVAACALGMLSKEVMVTAPLLVLLYDRTFVAGGFRAAWTRRRMYYLALAATWLVLAAVLTSDLSQRSVGFGLGVSAGTYTLASAQAVLLYLKLAVWPAPLVFDYGPVYGGVDAASFGSLAIIIAIVSWTVRALRHATATGFLAAAFLLLLAPTTSIVPVAEQPIAENRMYLPLAVVTCAVGVLVHRRIRQPAWAGVIVGLAAVGFGALTVARNHDYRTDAALWADTVAKRPQNPRAHFNLGLILLRLDRPTEALEHFQDAIRLRPGDSRSHNSLGTVLLALDRPAEAVAAIRAATQLDPGHAPAWHNLGLALLRTGDAAGAIDALTRAVALNPDHPATHLELGNAHFQLDRPVPAIAAYERALQLDPTLADAHYNAGSACLDLGRLEEALAHFAAALRQRPDDPEIHNHHGAALLRAGRVGEAIAAFEQALRLRPDYADARDNLALVRSGRR